MKYTIYRVVTRTNHTYVGQTCDLNRRTKRHIKDVNNGKLGYKEIPDSKNPMIEVLATCNDKATALILESRYIALEILDNPTKCCNSYIGRSNTYDEDAPRYGAV